MLNLVGLNDDLTSIVKIMSTNFVHRFAEYVKANSIVKKGVFYSDKWQTFKFHYLYLEDKQAIVITGFKQKKDVNLNLGKTISERIEINLIVNYYLDNNLSI